MKGSAVRIRASDLGTLGCDVAVVARSAESKGRAKAGGATAVVDRIASLPTVDGVIVATPTSTHADVLDEVLGLGVPVFCEKPLCDEPAAAAQLAELAADRLFVMDKWRYHPGILELAAIAREERLGAVSGLSTVRVDWGSPHDDADPVWVLAPHELAIALEVMGSVPSPQVAVAQWLGGDAVWLSAVLTGSGWWHTLEVSARSPARKRRIELHCADGVAVLADGWDEHVMVVTDGAQGAEETRVETPGELPLLAELRMFIAHLAGGPAPKSSVHEGAAIVAAITELRELAR